MKIKFHHLLAFFLVTLFLDFDYESPVIRIRIIDVFLVVLVILMILSASSFKTNNNPAAMAFYLFILYLLINGIIKIGFSTTIKEIFQLIEYVFLMHLIARATDQPKKRKEFLDILFWGVGCVAICAAIYNVSLGHYSAYKELDAPKHSFAVFALLAVIRFLTSKKKTQFQLLILLLSLAILLLSGERKGWVGFIVGGGVFTYLQLKASLSKKNIHAIATFFVIVVTLALVTELYLASQPQLRYLDRQLTSFSDVSNVFSDDNGQYASKSDEERIFMFNLGIELFVKNPVSGVGIDQFRSYVEEATSGEWGHDAHNFYIKILSEEGIIGIVLFLLPLFLLFVELWKKTRNKIPHIATDARIMLALFLLGSVVNFFLAAKALSWLYLVLPCGMVLGLSKELAFYKNVKE
jgi:O-antigen ligase